MVARELRERVKLVTRCLADPDLRDPRLLWALLRVPRTRFLPTDDRPPAWSAKAAASLEGQTVTDAPFVARTIADARLREGARVLEVGTGTGYQAAVLAAMGCDVTSIERVPALHAVARRNLAALGYAHVDLRCGAGEQGAPDRAPFDAILVACAAAAPPPALLAQLAPGGILMMPEGDPNRMQTWTRWQRTADGLERTPLRVTWFVPLVESSNVQGP